MVLFGPAAARLMERAGLRRALMLGLFLYGLLGAAGPYLRGAWLIYADRLLLRRHGAGDGGGHRTDLHVLHGPRAWR